MRLSLISVAVISAVSPPTSVADLQAQADVPDSVAVENLRAFARLYGYVRYFHPSDEAAELAWDEFAILGAEAVRDAATDEELRRALERLFAPAAPTLLLQEEGEPAPPRPPALAPSDTAGLQNVAWQHLGMGTGVAGQFYQSARLNHPRELTTATGPAVLGQSVAAGDLRGREVRFVGRIRALEPASRGQLWMRIDLEGGGRDFFDNMTDRPVRSLRWTEVVLEAQVHPEASAIVFGTITQEGGVAYADFRLEVRDHAGSWVPVPVENADFSGSLEADGSPAGWFVSGQGWTREMAEDPALPAVGSDARSLRVVPERFTMEGRLFGSAPEPGEVLEVGLGRGLVAFLPISLYSRGGRTLGTPDPDGVAWLETELARIRQEWSPGVAGTDHQALRVADVITAWNVFQHFYPYFDVIETDWDAVLTEGLTRALPPQTHAAFQRELEWLVARLDDGHGRVTGPFPTPQGLLPATLEQVEGQVVVVGAGEGSRLERGDVIAALDGGPADSLLALEAARFSGSRQWREFRALGELGRGDPGTPLQLTVLRRDEDEAVELTVERRPAARPPDPRPDPIAELEPGIFYVNLDVVALEAFEARAEELAAADAVVFDLRGYPNGNHLILSHLSAEPLQSAFWRIPRLIRPDFAEPVEYQESRWHLTPRQPQLRGRFVFITDGRAISYAESVMGIVAHYRLGPIVGQPTAGANGNVNAFTVPGGSRIAWTGMRVENHDRTLLHVQGIPPTHPTARTIAGIRDGRDELLEAAVALVRSDSTR